MSSGLLTLLRVHVIATRPRRSPLPSLGAPEHRPLLAALVNQLLHLDLGLALRLLDARLEHHDFVLLQGILGQLRAQSGFNAQVDFEVTVCIG